MAEPNLFYSRIRPEDDLVMAIGQIGLKCTVKKRAAEEISLDELNLSGQKQNVSQ